MKDALLNMIGNAETYNNYEKAKEGLLNMSFTSNNTTAVNKPWWNQSTTAAPQSVPEVYTIKPSNNQYGYDSDDDGYNPGRAQPYRTTDNTGGMPANWEEMWKRSPWGDPPAESEEDTASAAAARESQRRLVAEIIRRQAERREEERRLNDERRIDDMIMPSISEPIVKPAPVTAAPQPVSAPTEVPAIEDELRPLRFGPIVTPKQA